MRKVIVSEFVTLDGIVEDPGGAEGFEHGGWDADGSDRKRLASGLFPSWSPDGSGRHSLGASLLERLSGRVADEEPAFSPSGEKIAFVSYPGNDNAEIYLMNADGSGRIRLTGLPGNVHWPRCGPRTATASPSPPTTKTKQATST